MINEKTTQKVLFVGLIFLFLLTTRILLVTKVGTLLVSLVIVAFSIWVAFRLVENVVAGAWKMSGVIASRLMRKLGKRTAPNRKALESERWARFNQGC